MYSSVFWTFWILPRIFWVFRLVHLFQQHSAKSLFFKGKQAQKSAAKFKLSIKTFTYILTHVGKKSNFFSGLEESSLTFTLLYLFAALIQVGILLKLAGKLVNFLWNRGIDPDNAAIPYLTSIGDLLGGILLAGAVYFEHVMG